MVNLEIGDKVSWIEPMMVVPHPEGKTDSDGVVLHRRYRSYLQGEVLPSLVQSNLLYLLFLNLPFFLFLIDYNININYLC